MTLPDPNATSIDGVLWYPRGDNSRKTIRVSLMDIRAADDLVIGFDFENDMWTIARASDPGDVLGKIEAWEEDSEGFLFYAAMREMSPDLVREDWKAMPANFRRNYETKAMIFKSNMETQNG